MCDAKNAALLLEFQRSTSFFGSIGFLEIYSYDAMIKITHLEEGSGLGG